MEDIYRKSNLTNDRSVKPPEFWVEFTNFLKYFNQTPDFWKKFTKNFALVAIKKLAGLTCVGSLSPCMCLTKF